MTVKRPPLLTPDRIKFKKRIESKKCVIDLLTKLLAKGQSEVTKNDIFDALIAREKLGNTSIGNGVSIPRAHLPIMNPRAALLILESGLEMNTVDKKPVNVFLGVLIPEKETQEYGLLFTRLNKAFSNEENVTALTASSNPERIVTLFEKLVDLEME